MRTIPVPLIEAASVLALAAIVHARGTRRGSLAAGQLALAYALGYAALRFMVELLRGDGARGTMLDGRISTSQLLGIAVIAVLSVARGGRMRLVVAAMLLGAGAWLLRGQAHAQLALQPPAVVRIGAGWFTLGSSARDVKAAVDLCLMDTERPELCQAELFTDEAPARRVYLSAFAIDRMEVSNASYRRCVVANVCGPSRINEADPRLGDPELPVTGVTFHDAQRYCAWVGGRLPTEAQWEKAARGTDGRRLPWGNLWNSRLANHGRGLGAEDPVDGYNFAAPVDAFIDARSPYGLLNMAGNVAEWVADYYDERGYAELDSLDPTGPTQGAERVARGGSWRTPAFMLRVTHRRQIAEQDAQPDVGFRCSYAP